MSIMYSPHIEIGVFHIAKHNGQSASRIDDSTEKQIMTNTHRCIQLPYCLIWLACRFETTKLYVEFIVDVVGITPVLFVRISMLTLSTLQTSTAVFADSVGPDGPARGEPSRRDLHCSEVIFSF